MGQEHLFARAEQSVRSAPYAGVSQVPRYLLDISDCFFLVVSRCAAPPTLASARIASALRGDEGEQRRAIALL